MNYKVFIGLEVHIELKTKSKMFCSCRADYFGEEPNSLCCPVCLGLPGALPVPNKKAVEEAILIGLALNCQVNKESFFDRKNYFYPDLPKGYQISQFYRPLCYGGDLEIRLPTLPKLLRENNLPKRIRIREVHLEEDTGKLIHSGDLTLIDFNRSGVPLVEIVSEPDLETPEEVKEYLKKIQQIVRYLGVSDCDMEKGSMRCEPSISIKVQSDKKMTELPEYRVEIKNINSFRFAQKAVEYEIDRQRKILEAGGKVLQETRGWSEKKNATVSQREKEQAKDYRYFPEPDIPPMRFSDKDIKILKEKLPELPDKKMIRFIKTYGLNEYDAKILTEERWVAEYYEHVIRNLPIDGKQQIDYGKFKKIAKYIANMIINKRVDVSKYTPAQTVKIILLSMQKGGGKGFSDEELKKIIEKVLKENEKAVEDYKKGKEQALMFLIGCVMRETKGQAEAERVRELLISKISNF